MDATASLTFAPYRPAGQVFADWMLGAWRLFRSAPVRIFALSLFPILVEAALQVLPDVGIVVSKLLTPLASAWVLATLDRKARTGIFAPAQAVRLWVTRLPQLLLVSLLLAGVFVFQLSITAAIGGTGQALALALGDVAGMNLSRTGLAAILAAGVLPGSLLMFVGPRVLLDGVDVATALGESLRTVGRYWRPVTLLALLFAALVASLLWVPLLLLVLLPFATCVGYAAYRDVFDRTSPYRS